ncbi:DUF3124 domain-containing protein [Bacteroidota bacterium]
MKYLFLILSLLTIGGCTGDNFEKIKKRSHPSHIYKYVDIDKENLQYFEIDYVPVYSDIYHWDGTKRFLLTTTISIRNTSLVDSAFILSAIYYDSYGKQLNDYVASTILLSPLESIEFVVEEVENIGGAGANFIIEWGATTYANQLLVQSIMIGTNGQQGISFSSEAKVVQSSLIK